VEINPLLVREHDVVALDALIQLDSEGGASAHL
jgi:succinyl-CoA synthetase beta subunit